MLYIRVGMPVVSKLAFVVHLMNYNFSYTISTHMSYMYDVVYTVEYSNVKIYFLYNNVKNIFLYINVEKYKTMQ